MVSCRTCAWVGEEDTLEKFDLPVSLENALNDAISDNKFSGPSADAFQQEWTEFASRSVSQLVRETKWNDVLRRGIENHQPLLTGMDMEHISIFLSEFVACAETNSTKIKAQYDENDQQEPKQWLMIKQLSDLCSKIDGFPRAGRGTVASVMLQERDRVIDSTTTDPWNPFTFPVYGKTHIAYLVVRRVSADRFLCSVCDGGAGAKLFSSHSFLHETKKHFARHGHCILECSTNEVIDFVNVISRNSSYGSDNIFEELSGCIVEKINDESCPCNRLSEQELYQGNITSWNYDRRQVYLLGQIVGNCPIHNLLQALKVFIPDMFAQYDAQGDVDSNQSAYCNAVMLFNIFEVCLLMLQINRRDFETIADETQEGEGVLVESTLLTFFCEKFYIILLNHQDNVVENYAHDFLSETLKTDVFRAYDEEFTDLVKYAAMLLLEEPAGKLLLQ
jgi:hypothetical protein